jgi:hypothetical protein
MGVYRAPAQPDLANDPSAELLFDPPSPEAATRIAVGLVVVVFVPILACVTLAVLLSPSAGLIGLVIVTPLCVWLRRRRTAQGVVLSVRDGQLTLRPRRPREPVFVVRLVDLADVTLDTTQWERIEHGTSARTALAAIEGRRVDMATAGIVLVRSEGEPIVLGQRRLRYADATEWLGKLRSFLRRHDWLPEDERPPVSSTSPLA